MKREIEIDEHYNKMTIAGKTVLQMDGFLLNGPMDELLGVNFNHARSCGKSWIEPRW